MENEDSETIFKKAVKFYNKGNKQRAVTFFEMAAKKGNVSAMNSYAYMLQRGDGIPENKEEAIKYYKMAIDNGNIEAINNYAYILQRGDGIPENKEEAIKYYKMAINNENIGFISSEIADKEVFSQLFSESSKEITDLLKNSEIEYYEDKITIKKIIIHKINENRQQGKDQVTIDREIEFDSNGKLSNIADIAYNKDIYEKLYKTNYGEESKRTITYFISNNDKNLNKELITADIDKEGIIKFNFNEETDLENLKQEINGILNSFKNNEAFDYILSYLEYAQIQLIKKEEIKNDDIVFNTKCYYNIDNTLNTINSSLDEKNKNKLYICDFSYKNHCVQLFISNGKVNMINTSGVLFDNEELINKARGIFKNSPEVIAAGTKKEIEEKFQKKFPEKANQIKITESFIISQKGGNCVIASKINTVEFLIELERYNQKREKLIKINNRLIEIKNKQNDKQYNENEELMEEYKKLVEENKKLTKNDMIFSNLEDINNKSKKELEKEIKKAKSEIIKISEIPKYLNDINLFNKGEKKTKELQKEHFIILRKMLKAAYNTYKNHSKHFEEIFMEDIISKTREDLETKKNIDNDIIKEQEKLCNKYDKISKEFEEQEKQYSDFMYHK